MPCEGFFYIVRTIYNPSGRIISFCPDVIVIRPDKLVFHPDELYIVRTMYKNFLHMDLTGRRSFPHKNRYQVLYDIFGSHILIIKVNTQTK